MELLPSQRFAASLTSDVFNRRALLDLPLLEVATDTCTSRRGFLSAASACLALASNAAGAASNEQPLEFFPGEPPQSVEPLPATARKQLGQIPADFWAKPRELWLRRQGTRDEIRVVYWKDGKLLSEGYWKACALLRDVRANVMTAIDPTILDVMRGVIGYYQAWEWPFPIVATSGYRTVKTNRALSKEGAAKNSMHLYGKAVDLFIPGIPVRDVGALALYLQQGGVGFYPDRGFTHLDTGKLRVWRG